jgi:hypothetical protein
LGEEGPGIKWASLCEALVHDTSSRSRPGAAASRPHKYVTPRVWKAGRETSMHEGMQQRRIDRAAAEADGRDATALAKAPPTYHNLSAPYEALGNVNHTPRCLATLHALASPLGRTRASKWWCHHPSWPDTSSCTVAVLGQRLADCRHQADRAEVTSSRCLPERMAATRPSRRRSREPEGLPGRHSDRSCHASIAPR